MANVNGNYGFNANSVFEKLDKYLNKKGSDLDKLSAEQLTSIFEASEKNEDGSINFNDFGVELMEELTQQDVEALDVEFLELLEEISAVDGEDLKISSKDVEIVGDLLGSYQKLEAAAQEPATVENSADKESKSNDGVKTTTVTSPDGTVTTTVEAEDGTVTTTTTAPDGTVTTVVTNAATDKDTNGVASEDGTNTDNTVAPENTTEDAVAPENSPEDNKAVGNPAETTPAVTTHACDHCGGDGVVNDAECFTEDARIKEDENGNKYINVEAWRAEDGGNDCLSRIIENCYDLKALGIEPYSEEYFALEKAIMDANPEIYGDENGEGGRPLLEGHDGERHSKVIHAGDKIILPVYPETAETAPVAENPEATAPVEPTATEQPTTSPEPTTPAATDPNKSVGGDPQAPITEGTLTPEQANAFAQQLLIASEGWGTNEGRFESILKNENLNAADIVNIMNAFGEISDKSLINTIYDEFSGKDQNEYLKIVTEAMGQMAGEGSPEAIELLCKEVFAATEGRIGTNDEVLKYFFESASDEAILALVENYSKFNEGSDLFRALDKDLNDETYNKYVDRINQAIINQGSESSSAEDVPPTSGVPSTTVPPVEEEAPVEGEEGVDDVAEQQPITSAEAAQIADQLHESFSKWGTDEDFVNSILNSSNYSSADIMLIMQTYQTAFGKSLIEEVQEDFSGKAEKGLVDTMVNSMLTEVENGSIDAIEMISNEIYAATEDRWGTYEYLLESILANSSDETLKTISANYSNYNDGSNLLEVLKKELNKNLYAQFEERILG